MSADWFKAGVAPQRVVPTSLGIAPGACTILNKVLVLLVVLLPPHCFGGGVQATCHHWIFLIEAGLYQVNVPRHKEELKNEREDIWVRHRTSARNRNLANRNDLGICLSSSQKNRNSLVWVLLAVSVCPSSAVLRGWRVGIASHRQRKSMELAR